MRHLALAMAMLAVPAAAETPMAVAATGHVTVPVEIAGHGTFPFVLDTGAEGTAVYARFADERKFAPAAADMAVTGQTGQAAVAAVELGAVGFDGVTAPNITAVRLPDRADGVPLAGIVGLDVFGRHVLTMDYRRMTAALARPGQVRVPARAVRATLLPGGLLGIPVTLNGRAGTAVVDTGARETRINRRFAAAAGIVPTAGAADTTIHGATGNAAVLLPAVARTVAFAGTRRAAAPIKVADLPVFATFGLADRPAMILGSDYLAGRRLTVDFPGRRVWTD